MKDFATIFQKRSDDEMKDAGVHTSKVALLRNLGFTTPVPRRAIKLPAYLKSPFLQHYGSSSLQTDDAPTILKLDGMCPLDDSIGELPGLELRAAYYEWLDTGLLAKNRKNFYSEQANEISPPLKLGGKFISQKIWFHAIEYSSFNLANSHIDVFFYYLRKKLKGNADFTKKITTTDFNFQKMILSLYADMPDIENIDESKDRSRKDILGVINGSSLPYGTPWSLVEYVFIPLWLAEENHWILAILNFYNRQIYVCNTLENNAPEAVLTESVLPFSKLLPHFLVLTDFYTRTDIDFSAKCYLEKGKTACLKSSYKRSSYPRIKEMESGMYMISIAEYLAMNKEFPKDSFDLDAHRSRLGFSFYTYGMGKHIYDYESETEYVNNANEDANDYVQNVKPKKRKSKEDGEAKNKLPKRSKKNKETVDYVEIL